MSFDTTEPALSALRLQVLKAHKDFIEVLSTDSTASNPETTFPLIDPPPLNFGSNSPLDPE